MFLGGEKMGGSYSSDYSFGSDETLQSDCCGGIYKFRVILVGDEEQIWDKSNEGDYIKIVLVNEDLPRLEVRKTSDDFLIGYVPPKLTKLIKCIDNGWKYEGKIVNISGNKYNPEIYVEIEGVF